MDGHDADDPKQSTGDMTVFVQNLLPQMQSRFQSMSDSIISKTILFVVFLIGAFYEQKLRKQYQRIDEMGSRIDELEQSINDLRAEMGQEGSPSPSATLKSNEETKAADE